MSWSTVSSMNLFELMAAALRHPLSSLIVAALILAGAVLVRRARSRSGRSVLPARSGVPSAEAQYVLERRTLGVGAIGVIAIFAVEFVVHGYLLTNYDTVDWWHYAAPVVSAILALAVVFALIVFRGTVAPERLVVSTLRRTWSSFGPRRGLIGAVTVVIVFLVTTLAAGVASSPDDRGRYIYLEISAPNTSIDPLRPWFYGWAYGVPVIVCVAALLVMTWATLHSNALRPFLRPETVGAEQRSRVEVAAGAVHIASAGMLLALGGAFRFISRSGSYTQLTIDRDGRSDSYELSWQYANLAVAAGWLAPALEITAFVLLLIIARRSLQSPPRPQLSERIELSSSSESMR